MYFKNQLQDICMYLEVLHSENKIRENVIFIITVIMQSHIGCTKRFRITLPITDSNFMKIEHNNFYLKLIEFKEKLETSNTNSIIFYKYSSVRYVLEKNIHFFIPDQKMYQIK